MDAPSLLGTLAAQVRLPFSFLDHFAEMDADREIRCACPARPQRCARPSPFGLQWRGSLRRRRCEFDDAAVARALDDAPMVHGDGRIDQVASERPQPRQNPVLVGSSKPRIADDAGHQDRRELSSLAHSASAEAGSPIAGGMGMAAFPCCTDDTRRPEMQARCSTRRSSLANQMCTTVDWREQRRFLVERTAQRHRSGRKGCSGAESQAHGKGSAGTVVAWRLSERVSSTEPPRSLRSREHRSRR